MVWWFALALALQLVGSAVTAFEVWQTHARWREEFGRPSTGTASGVVAFRGTGWGVAEVIEPEGLTVEERLQRLEERQETDHRAVSSQLRDLERAVPTIAADQAAKVEDRLRPEIARTVQYLAGQGQRPRWLPWWAGPSLILLGTLINGVASVVDVAAG